jgi:MinD-like ATPase involved in chromosome partitioning or flagellar assembly
MVDQSSPPIGKIITFYSYKGGTGRTMLLANVAWILASNGYKVLIIDWDLEAPGLHRYLRPFLLDHELKNTPGLVDFVWDAAKKVVTPYHSDKDATIKVHNEIDIQDYIVGINWEFNSNGLIDFIPAGQQNGTYPQKVNTFDWDNFYERLGGGKILQAARDSLRANYDYILIDSRTGVSDTSSICTVQLPDVVVICFTLNNQSISGAGAVAASIRAQKGDRFPIYPIPTRLENAEEDKKDRALKVAREVFNRYLDPLVAEQSNAPVDGHLQYWADVGVPYRTFYAFEEIPATFKDAAFARDTILASSERIASRLVGKTISLVADDADKRSSVVSSFAFPREGAANTFATPTTTVDPQEVQKPLRPPPKVGWRPERYTMILVLGMVALGIVGGTFAYHKIDQLDATIVAKNSEIHGLNDTVASKDNDIVNLNGTIALDGKEISNLKGEVNSRNYRIDQLNKSIYARESEIKSLTDQLGKRGRR